MKGIVVFESKLFALRQQNRPHKKWFEVTVNIVAQQLKWDRSNSDYKNITDSQCELNEIFDYFTSVADEAATSCWRFWTRATAEEAITYARLKWE